MQYGASAFSASIFPGRQTHYYAYEAAVAAVQLHLCSIKQRRVLLLFFYRYYYFRIDYSTTLLRGLMMPVADAHTRFMIYLDDQFSRRRARVSDTLMSSAQHYL